MLAILALLMTGCGANIFIERYVPTDADEFIRGYIDKLRSGEIEAALAQLDPKTTTETTTGALKEMAAVLGQGEILSVKLVKFRNVPSYFTGTRRSSLTYHVELSGVWLHLTTVVDRAKDGALSVYGLYVRRLPGSPAEMNTFGLAGKTPRHYFVLFLALGVHIFIIYTAVLCVRTRMHRKWRWFILVLLGAGNFMFDWTSGLWGLRLVSGWFMGGLILRDGLDGPWMIYIALPVGAILFHIRRRVMTKHYHYVERYLAGQGKEDE
jgi:hypothetical protein